MLMTCAFKVALGLLKLASDDIVGLTLPDDIQRVLKSTCESLHSAADVLCVEATNINVSHLWPVDYGLCFTRAVAWDA
jgi:hypothetical protein